jgi:sugar phosphate isomerase/epimerase
MKIVLNSKFFAKHTVEQLGEKIAAFGYDGVDICVRSGHPIRVDNAIRALPKAVQIWRSQGLVCPLATAEVTMNNPKSPDAEILYAACAEANIPRLKIGFWRFNPGDDYWQILDTARADLEGFIALSEKFGVRTCYQIHSGPCVGSNCAGLMHLIKGFDPKHIGAYPDLGHLALDGEDYDMGLSMLHEYLSIVGIKDAKYARQPKGATPLYIPSFVKVGDGCVDWQRALGALRNVGFNGPLTVHTEYSFDESIIRRVGYAEISPPNLDRFAKEDVAYLRRILSSLYHPKGP